MSESKPLRLSNPFRRRVMPDHMIAEQIAHQRWTYLSAAGAVSATIAAFLLTPLIHFLATAPFQKSTLAEAQRFFELAAAGKLVAIHLAFAESFGPDPFAAVSGTLFAYLACILPIAFLASVPAILNPYRDINHKEGFADWCDEATLEKMEERRQVGVRDGYLCALGIWPSGRRRGQLVRLIEALSVLCLAPPGTGKTAGLVVPTIVTSPTVSFIVNDTKPELWDMTAAYRARHSHVFMLDWSKVDDPRNAVFYPRFNFLSPRLVPKPGPNRDTYLDTVAKTLIPDKKAAGDTYFVDKGRAALTGFLHYIVAQITDRSDADRYLGFPARWEGHEPSIPMLVDWVAQAQFDATGGDTEDHEPGSTSLSQWVRQLCDQIRPNSAYPTDHENNRGRSERAFNELSTLVNMADKERSGVLGTMDQAFLPFKNAAVKERTSASDFTPDDLRGIVDPKTGEEKPVTIYICVNQAEAAAFATITALLYEVISLTLLTYGPGQTNERSGRTLGPHTVCFCLDEFAKLPKIEAVLTGPDLGRSKKTSYLLVAQDFGQIEKTYSKEDVQIIISTTAVKHVLPQNNPQTIEQIQKMTGRTTIKDRSASRTEGLSKQYNPLAANVSESLQGVDFLRREDISAIEPGKHLLLVQGFLNRPMRVNTPLYFKHADLIDRVHWAGNGPKATADHYLPGFIRDQRIAEHETAVRAARAAAARRAEAENRLFGSEAGVPISPELIS